MTDTHWTRGFTDTEATYTCPDCGHSVTVYGTETVTLASEAEALAGHRHVCPGPPKP